LTVKRIATLKPGKHVDGGGLALLVYPIGTKVWSFRFERKGRDRAMVLGPLHGNGGNTTVPRAERRGLTLAEARAEAADLLKLLKSGIDPIEARKSKGLEAAEAAAEKAKRKTFEEVAVDYDAAKSSDWTNKNYRAKFLSSLKMYVYPTIGKLPVEMIDTVLVKNILAPIWLTKNPTADRLRARIEAVLPSFSAVSLIPSL
jgi:Arm DNA-binding domain